MAQDSGYEIIWSLCGKHVWGPYISRPRLCGPTRHLRLSQDRSRDSKAQKKTSQMDWITCMTLKCQIALTSAHVNIYSEKEWPECFDVKNKCQILLWFLRSRGRHLSDTKELPKDPNTIVTPAELFITCVDEKAIYHGLGTCPI
jgi:hypothetical protein